jgi:hypothetical protein
MRRITPLVVLVLLLVPSAADAQRVTPWGDPDLQGIWSNQTPIPLERPDELAGKRFFTAAEAAAIEKTALDRVLKTFAHNVAVSGELNEVWLESQNGRVPTNRSTSLVVDPIDGKVPYTPEGRKRWDAVPKLGPTPLGTDRPEDRNLTERCITTDGLFVPNPFYNNYHQILQAPGYVVIVTEMMHETRIVPLDRRPRLGSAVRTWQGDSRGRWEAQTLVVETTNFNDRRLFQGATEQLRLEERFTRRDDETIEYRLTVIDPATFARQWTLENSLRKATGGLYEIGCHEGNSGLRNILAGARAQEQR